MLSQVKLIEAGDEAGAKERLEKLRNAPSITGAKVEMPAVLSSWGCDEALWGDSAPVCGKVLVGYGLRYVAHLSA